MQVPMFEKSSLIVSCQAWPGSPLDDVEVIRRLARAAVQNGAGGIRANGPAEIRAIRQDTDVPIIGIQKRYFGDEVRITPDFASAQALADAGASVIALDCTHRPPLAGEPWQELIRRIHDELGLPVMADIATLKEGRDAAAASADLIGTTLCGYTPDTAHLHGVPWALLDGLVASVDRPIILEGHVWHPHEARMGIERGAIAVVVGTAITRPGDITRRFVQAVTGARTAAWVVGIDIGGTAVKAALVHSSGRVEGATQVPTDARGGRAAIRAAVHQAAQQILAAAARQHLEPIGIGVASAGAIDAGHGTVFAATDNLPGWSGFDLRGDLEAAFALPVYVENDAHAVVLAELRFGQGRRWKDFAVITIGTGLGGGFVMDGRLVRGSHGFAGGFGHHSIRFDGVPCNCGRRGCLEAYVSASALVREYSTRSGIPPASLSAAEVAARAQQGDAAAQGALQAMAASLAEGLANLWNHLDPEAVILAGGVAQIPGWAELVHRELLTRMMFANQRNPVVTLSDAGLYAGVQGAAVPVLEAFATGTLRKTSSR